MVTEEIHLNRFLEENGIESVETDLGEYIQQLDGEPPYHIVTPAMHKSKEDVARLFTEKLNTPPDLSPEELTLVARERLRAKYTEAEVGVTGANFIIADIGGVAVTENEGNARLSLSWPKVHIVVAATYQVGLELLQALVQCLERLPFHVLGPATHEVDIVELRLAHGHDGIVLSNVEIDLAPVLQVGGAYRALGEEGSYIVRHGGILGLYAMMWDYPSGQSLSVLLFEMLFGYLLQ
jgi:hypothetical protein